MSAPVRPVIRVVPGVCPVPKSPDATTPPCGGEARFFACGWRCATHRPGRNNNPSKET